MPLIDPCHGKLMARRRAVWIGAPAVVRPAGSKPAARWKLPTTGRHARSLHETRPTPSPSADLSTLDAGALTALIHGWAGDDAKPGDPVRASGVVHAIPAVAARLLSAAVRAVHP